MRLSDGRVFLIGAISLVVIGTGLLVARVLLVRPLPHGHAQIAPEQWARLQKQLSAIRSESIEESLANLTRDDDQYSRADTLSSSKGAQVDCESLLSSRRFLRIEQEMTSLPPAAASALIHRTFDEAFASASAAMDHILRRRLDPALPENDRSLLTHSRAMEACTVLAAQRGDIHFVSSSIARRRALAEMYRRKLASDNRLASPSLQLLIDRYLVPDRRFQLTALLTACERGPTRTAATDDAIRRAIEVVERTTLSLPKWDAEVTPFDFVHRQRGLRPTAGNITVVDLYNWRVRDAGRQEAAIVSILNSLAARPQDNQ